MSYIVPFNISGYSICSLILCVPLPPIFISTILQSGKFLNLRHYFPHDVKLRLLAHSRSFLEPIKKLEMQ